MKVEEQNRGGEAKVC